MTLPPDPSAESPADPGGREDAAGDDVGAASGAEPRPARRPFLLRLPPDLFDELRRWAAADLRSLNGQIEFLLRDAVRRRRE